MSLILRTGASSVYNSLYVAVSNRQAVKVYYKGYYRYVCPHTLGLKNGREKVLTYQFGGGSSSGLPPGGEWRCMFVADMTSVEILDVNEWHSGGRHTQPQTCVDAVDIETV